MGRKPGNPAKPTAVMCSEFCLLEVNGKNGFLSLPGHPSPERTDSRASLPRTGYGGLAGL